MKITKLEHACLDIARRGTRLIIDPGVWTSPLAKYDDIAALVITHVHPDHCDPDKVATIIDANPNVQIFSTEQVAEKLQSTRITVVEIGKAYSLDNITLEFFGGQHAKIMDNYPIDQNIGVLVDDALYYPGDSFANCSKPHKVTAVPVFAPWLKFSEVAEFLTQDNADNIFPTHNNIANQNGNELLHRLLGMADLNKTIYDLSPGEFIEI